MRFLETARTAPGWRSGMELSIVDSYSMDDYGDYYRIAINVIYASKLWVFEKVELKFDYVGNLPQVLQWRGVSIKVLDNSLCPDGCLLVDNEKMIGRGDIYEID